MFAYCNNNPVNTADPAGKMRCNILDDPDMFGGYGRSNPESKITCNTGATHNHEFRDVTEEVDAALNNAMWDGFLINKLCGKNVFLYYTKLKSFRDEVDHCAPWDIKRKSSWENTIGTPFPGVDVLVVYHEVKITPENLGNITYGVIGRAYGIDLITLLGGSYVAAGCPIEGSALDNEIIVDQPCIILGYDAIFPILFDKYYGDGG